MKRILSAFLLLALLGNPAYGAISPSYPVTLQNGTTADASQVMADFYQIQSDVNTFAAHNGANSDITSLTGLTTALALQYGGTPVYVGGTTGGSANAQTLVTVSPTSFALTAGSMVTGIAGYSNSGAATLAVNGLAAKAVDKGTSSGLAALTGGEIIANNPYLFYYDGTQFEVLNPTLPTAIVTGPGSSTSGDIATFNGTSGNVIQDSGLSATSFIRKVVRQEFTSSGTYTPTTGMVYADIEVWGAGGAGGGAPAAAGAVGAGGGSGAYSKIVVTAATVGASQTVTIGAAGAGGSSTGGTGGDTSVGSICVAKGGIGGGVGVGGSFVLGGAGGVASSGTGDIKANGSNGGAGTSATGSTNAQYSGAGGNAGILSGGGYGQPYSAEAVGIAGAANSGGGGGGAASNGSAHNGGAGGSGYVVVTEYLNQ